MGPMRPTVPMSWKEFGAYAQALGAALSSYRPRYDVVVGVARGGLPLAVSLAHRLAVGDFRIWHIGRTTGDLPYSSKHEPLLIWASSIETLRGKDVLLVDDIAGTGATLRFARDRLHECGAARVTVCTVVARRNTGLVPDFFATETDDWIVFP